MLSENDITLVKSTIPTLEQAGPAATEHFYRRMFQEHPELHNIFNISNQKTGRQPIALFQAIALYAKNLEQPATLTPLIERVANKHSAFFIQPEHYPIVGKHLLGTLQELAPETFTPPILEAWKSAYDFLARLLIQRESQLYSEKATQTGGWTGTKEFVVAHKKFETDRICSFVLKPKDGGPVPTYHPGQYLSIQCHPTQTSHDQFRQYSLSCAANTEYFRISVKRETTPHPGLISNYLHDSVEENSIVKVLPPAGDFYLNSTEDQNVFISAGVGITPMMAMLEAVTQSKHPQPTWFLHANHDQNHHPFQEAIQSLKADGFPIHTHTWYKETAQQNISTSIGRMDITAIKQSLPIQNGQFYLCGPIDFMKTIYKQLLEAGVPKNQIHYELFGPHLEL